LLKTTKYSFRRKKKRLKEIEELKSGMTTTASGLMYKITKTTDGAQPVAGNTVSVHYTGKLTSGQVFDSSISRNEPIEFVGTGRVIKGWDEGILY
jgi:FKBP-type peptidyl-prolyl cis-trans isomerase